MKEYVVYRHPIKIGKKKSIAIIILLIIIIVSIYIGLNPNSSSEENCPEVLQLDTINFPRLESFTTTDGGSGIVWQAKDGTDLWTTCKQGSTVGENVNYFYCYNGLYKKEGISEEGIIQKPIIYSFEVVFDTRSCQPFYETDRYGSIKDFPSYYICNIISIKCK